jgi:small subunit ribosomal protein S17
MKKPLIGKIISTKMNKTVVVEVIRKTPHPLYKKLIKRSKNLKADSGELTLNVGDKVKIVQTKPISKDKFFKVLEVIK